MNFSGLAALQIVFLLFVTKEIHGGTYSVVHPKLFRIDSDERIVVNMHGYGSTEIQVQAWLRDYPRKLQTLAFKDLVRRRTNNSIIFEMKVSRENYPNAETLSNKKVELHVRIRFPRSDHSQIDKKVIIYLTGQSDYVFVQTNRPIYRPGETVSIRAVVLNSHMLPMKTPGDLFEITVRTSEGIGIYRIVKRFHHFITAVYKIPEDPPLGSYFAEIKLINKTHTSKGSAEFKVDKYVLPTFEVEIELDKTTVKPDGRIDGKFKAKYSYGKPVVGTYGITASLHIPEREPLIIYTKPSDPARKRPGLLMPRDNGVKTFTVPIREAVTESEMEWSELIESGATVRVQVHVMGDVEGIMETDQKDGILITNTPYFIDMSQSSQYFIPTLQQDINIVVRDIVTKQPVPGVDVLLSVADGVPVRGRSDAKGAMRIPIDTPHHSAQLRLTIKTNQADLNNDDQAMTSFILTRHESPYGFLRMRTNRNHASVGDRVYVTFTTRNHRPSEIFYVILSRGLILAFEKKEIVGSGDASVEITITREMSPSIRVVAYFMNANNIVSDSISVDVDDVCVSDELSIQLSQNETKPGRPVKVTYQGQPRAWIGTAAVDRAAYFLHNGGRLDRHQMFEKMKLFDMGCSVSGGRNAVNVFEEAGLALATGNSATSNPPSLECPGKVTRKKRNIATHGFTLAQRILKKRCHSDGRKENIADLRCDIRSERIELLELNDHDLCMEEFLEGCRIGESIRNSSAFRIHKQRSGTVRMDPDSGQKNVRRINFDEGWLWIEKQLSNEGLWAHAPAPPHSITTYDIDAMSVHVSEGFCIAKPAELKVFKDFFIQLYLPYSVKVMEQVQIRAAVFNYHTTKDRRITLKIKTDEELCTQGTPGKFSTVATQTVGRDSSESFTFTMIPLAVPESDGIARIWLSVDPLDDESARDDIERTIKIEPTGSEEDFSGSLALDPLSAQPRPIEFEFPDADVLPQSKKCWIYGYMSFLGPIIEFDPIAETPQNLDKALSLPHGCGEQNMKSVGPNVFAFNYMKYVGETRQTSRDQVQKYIIDGYTRQQSHRNNGRWSIWSNAPPTIWINAYVNKVFLHAREVWPDMDIGPICRSLEWMVASQRSDGAFAEPAHSRHYWINVAEGGEVALTAYVLVTLAERYADCPSKALNSNIMQAYGKATEYLKRTVRQSTIPYTEAIVAYALALVDTRHDATRAANGRLLRSKTQSGAEVFWQGPIRENRNIPAWKRRKQSTLDIETTAYALLAQVKIADDMGSHVPESTVEMINKISRWLVNQQNGRGGFGSSQTTVIGIQAMTAYAKWIHDLRPPPRNPRLRVRLTAPGTSWSGGTILSLDARQEFYRKELPVPDDVVTGTRSIQVSVAGEGKGTLSYRCVYRSTKDQEICEYNIVATTEMLGYRGDDGESEAAPGEGMNAMKLVLEVSKNGRATGMAIVDISLISGFRPVESSLDGITIKDGDRGAVDGILDNYEVTDHNIVLYLEKIPGSSERPLQIGFLMQQAVEVKMPSPAKIVVYDYYNPEDKCSKFYSVPDGSPMIRTSCAPDSLDLAAQRTCKCAEGGCPTCRLREEQLEKTCVDRASCRGCANCMNLRDSICRQNYGFFADVTGIDKDSMPQFVKIRATVKEIVRLQSSDTNLVKNQERTFVIRRDCFDKCRDDVLKTTQTYFTVGQTYLIRGNEPIVNTQSTGQKSFDYFLDRDATVERALSEDKCSRYESWEERCTGVEQNEAHCVKKMGKIRICMNQRKMREQVYQGCD